MKKKALGKGLGVFLPDDYGILKDERFAEVEIEEIQPNPLQPRMEFDQESIAELAQSIKESGVIQPIVVVPDGEKYRIVVGERRWRAAQKAGLKKIPVLIRSIPQNREVEISLIENLQRKDLNPLEVARVYERMIRELGYTQEEVAERVGKDRSSVANTLRILGLPPEVLELLARNKISLGHARALVSLEDPEKQVLIAREIVSRDLSVREAERVVSKRESRRKKADREAFDADLRSLEEELVRILGTKVEIRGDRKRGAICIMYYSLDELNRIYGTIKGAAR